MGSIAFVGGIAAYNVAQQHILPYSSAGFETDVHASQVQILPPGHFFHFNPGAAPVHQRFLPGRIHAVGVLLFSSPCCLFLPGQMDRHHLGLKLQPVANGIAVRLCSQVSRLLPEILEILGILLADAWHQHRQRTIVPAASGLHEPGLGRKAHQGNLLKHLRLVFRQPLIHVPAAACVQGVHDLAHGMAQGAHALDMEGDGIGQGVGRSDDERTRPVPGIGVLDAGNGFVAAAAAAEHITVRPAAAIVFPGHLAGVLRCRRAGLPDSAGMGMASESAGGLHIGLDEIGSVCQTESDGVVLAASGQGRNLLIGARERTHILIEPAFKVLFHGKAEDEFGICVLKAAVDIAERHFAAVRHAALPQFVRIDKRLCIAGILFCVINQLLTHWISS